MASKPTIAAIRRAVADYMASEGCGCCGNGEAHKEHAAVLGKLLRVKKFEDGSGYDFWAYRTQAEIVRQRRKR